MTRPALAPVGALAAAALLLAACSGGKDAPAAAPADPATPPPAADAAPAGPASYTATVVTSYPHDPSAFTEGLFFADGRLFESTGLEGKSEVREVELTTGAVKRRRPLDAQYFGEGVVAFGPTLYQLTWKSGKAFTYDLATFAPRPTTHTYEGEGWGLTTDGTSLIQSNGSDKIVFRDPTTFAVTRTIAVHDGPSPVSQLNELEWVKGEILANVWQSTQIVRINPADGAVTGWVDLGGVLGAADRTGREDVLNGIAYDARTDKLYVTGKYYSRLYEVRLERR